MKRSSFIQFDDYVTVRCFAFTFRCHGAIVLESQVDDPPFTGCHRFQTNFFPCPLYLGCQPPGQGFQGILTAFPVVFHIQEDEIMMVEFLACRQVYQVLEGIQGLSVFTDENPQSLAVEVTCFFIWAARPGVPC